MKFLKNAYININVLDTQQKENILTHYKNKENIYILTNNKNIEYKITNIIDNKINLEFTGVIYE